MDYTYTILSVDNPSKTMVVRFETDGRSPVDLNINIPVEGSNINEHIEKYSPIQMWLSLAVPSAAVSEGYTGIGTYVQPEPTPEPDPQSVTSGSINEEYLRALIFQVLEEIKAAAV